MKPISFAAHTMPDAPDLSREALAYMHKAGYTIYTPDSEFNNVTPYVIHAIKDEGMQLTFHNEADLVAFCQRRLIELHKEPIITEADLEAVDDIKPTGPYIPWDDRPENQHPETR